MGDESGAVCVMRPDATEANLISIELELERCSACNMHVNPNCFTVSANFTGRAERT